jgi:hypothetical protein
LLFISIRKAGFTNQNPEMPVTHQPNNKKAGNSGSLSCCLHPDDNQVIRAAGDDVEFESNSIKTRLVVTIRGVKAGGFV